MQPATSVLAPVSKRSTKGLLDPRTLKDASGNKRDTFGPEAEVNDKPSFAEARIRLYGMR